MMEDMEYGNKSDDYERAPDEEKPQGIQIDMGALIRQMQKEARMKAALTTGVACGMIIGFPTVIYCIYLSINLMANYESQKLCLVESDQLRPIIYKDDQIPYGVGNSINWQINFIALLGCLFFYGFISLVFFKKKSPIYPIILGISVMILGFDICVYLPYDVFVSEAHSYQVCAGAYLTEVFGQEYFYNQDFLKEKDYYSINEASILIRTAKIYLTIFTLVFL